MDRSSNPMERRPDPGASPAAPSRAAAEADSGVLRLGADWFLAHGLGNDYLVFSEASVDEEGWPGTPGAIAAVCDRWRGLGSDGIVVRLREPSGELSYDPVRSRAFNPDGSEFERSGNGIRVLAASLAFSEEVPVGGEPFPLIFGGGRVVCRLLRTLPGGGYDIQVDMGRAAEGPGAVGMDPQAAAADGTLAVEGAGPSGGTARIPFRSVSMGNPHCVVFPSSAGFPALHEGDPLEVLGPRLVAHPAFARGTNVQLVTPVDRAAIRIRIWERGVGPTSASGTSACAAAVASVAEGIVDPGEIRVEMDGGNFQVTVRPGREVLLRGPVGVVATGSLAPGFVQGLAQGG